MATAAGVTVNGYDTNGNADGIRLIRAYLSTDANAKPIVPANKRFAENTIAASFNGFANPGPATRSSTASAPVTAGSCARAAMGRPMRSGTPTVRRCRTTTSPATSSRVTPGP